MSRSGYSDDCEGRELAMWRGQVASAIRGKRGQTFLSDLIAALDAMPEKRLIAEELRTDGGAVCALGALGERRGIALDKLNPDNYNGLARAFGVAHQLVQEVEFMNDEASSYKETPEDRWRRMRSWAERQITVKAAP